MGTVQCLSQVEVKGSDKSSTPKAFLLVKIMSMGVDGGPSMVGVEFWSVSPSFFGGKREMEKVLGWGWRVFVCVFKDLRLVMVLV